MPISAGSAAGASAVAAAPGKTPFLAAVEITEDGKAHRVKLRRVRRFTKKKVKKITARIATRGARVVTDGLGCFNGVADAGCTHEPVVAGSGSKAAHHPAYSGPSTRCSATSRSAIA